MAYITITNNKEITLSSSAKIEVLASFQVNGIEKNNIKLSTNTEKGIFKITLTEDEAIALKDQLIKLFE